MAVPQTYEEYLEELGGKLSWFERLADGATGIDERLDLNNKLSIENLKLLREGLKAQYPSIKIYYRPNLPHYSVLTFPLDTARPDPGEEVPMAGDMITAFTDGTLDGIYIRPEPLPTDPIPLNEFNPYRLLPGWTSFWLETTSQPGKYLRLHIGEAASGEASVGTVRTNIIAQIIGVYLQPEWASLQGFQKNFHSSKGNSDYGDWCMTTYSVPTGKKLYVNYVIGSCYPTNVADADLLHHCSGFSDITSPNIIIHHAGNGGFSAIFPSPLVVNGGGTFECLVACRANHNCVISIDSGGYEL